MQDLKYAIQTLFYADGKKYGLKIHQIGHNNLKCFQAPRSVLKFIKQVEDIKQSGVYFLLNSLEKQGFILGKPKMC
jgi:hypothetical protein